MNKVLDPNTIYKSIIIESFTEIKNFLPKEYNNLR